MNSNLGDNSGPKRTNQTTDFFSFFSGHFVDNHSWQLTVNYETKYLLIVSKGLEFGTTIVSATVDQLATKKRYSATHTHKYITET